MSESQNAIKSRKLGMNFGTARARLERDLLFQMAVAAGHTCYRCGGPLDRENFSLDHKQNWGSAENPKRAFFDLQNVAFSHHHCNSAHTDKRRGECCYQNGCRCAKCLAQKARYRGPYDADKRRGRYVKYGT